MQRLQPTSSTFYLTAITLALLLGIPLLWQFPPDSNFHYSNAVGQHNSGHSTTLLQMTALVTGIVLTLLAGLPLYKSWKSKSDQRLLDSLLFLLIFAVGYKNYPYWICGLQHVDYAISGGGFNMGMLWPGMFLSVAWSLIILLFYCACFVSIPIVLLALIVGGRWQTKYLFRSVSYILLIALIVSSFYITPHYLVWLID